MSFDQIAVRVPSRMSMDASAERAELKTRHRVLVTPLKNATDNSRRWLLEHLGAGLSPSEAWWAMDTARCVFPRPVGPCKIAL